MNFDWRTWLGILLVPLIALGVLYISGERNRAPTGTFEAEGNLVKNNPGFAPDVWYLLYEKPGTPGLAVKLEFNPESTCLIHGVHARCDMSFEQGERVRIEGKRYDDTVLVDTLYFVESPAENGLSIKLYFYNPSRDQGPGGAQCTEKGLVAVERIIPKTQTPLKDSIELLLRGEISDEERAQGIESEFPLEGVKLEKAVIEDGKATLTFSDPQNKTVGGSCRVSVLWHQIEATAKQFPSVQSVHFKPEELFQP